MAEVGAAVGRCRGPTRAASAATLSPTGVQVERQQAAAVALAGRELESLEARLLGMLASQQVQQAAELREADKLAGLAGRFAETRVDELERCQGRLEQRLAEISEAVKRLCRQQESQDERTAFFAAETRERLEQLWDAHGSSRETQASSLGSSPSLEGRVRVLEAGSAQTEALERRLKDLEERWQHSSASAKAHSPHPAAANTADGHGARGARAEEGAFAANDLSGERLAAGDAALLAVQELDSVMRSELKSIRKKCNTLRDELDERTIVSLKEIEQRLQEQDKLVRQVLGASQESSARLEEHEFRLGVSRTKLEVHDQKISRLEAVRWQRGSSGSFGDADRGGCGTPSSASPCVSPSAGAAPNLQRMAKDQE